MKKNEDLKSPWKRKPVEERGVLCGANQACEWLLPWWWSRYQDHNDLPVTFCDFGLSDEAKEWCRERGELLPVDPVRVAEASEIDPDLIAQWEAIYGPSFWRARPAWFQKPRSLLATPYQRSVWVDLDCEILSSLLPVFAFCTSTCLGIVREFSHSHLPRFHLDSLYNGGIICFEHGTPLIEQWAEAAVRENHRFWGDDPLLSHLINTQEIDVVEIPEIWNWRIAQGVNIGAAIFHWTGAGGKNFVRAHGGLKPMLDSLFNLQLERKR